MSAFVSLDRDYRTRCGPTQKSEAQSLDVGHHRVMREWERLRAIDEVCGIKCGRTKCAGLSVWND
jgi:hypothetical protein